MSRSVAIGDLLDGSEPKRSGERGGLPVHGNGLACSPNIATCCETLARVSGDTSDKFFLRYNRAHVARSLGTRHRVSWGSGPVLSQRKLYI